MSVKFHKADEPVLDQQKATPLVPPAPGAEQVRKIEDTPHKREETVDIAMAK